MFFEDRSRHEDHHDGPLKDQYEDPHEDHHDGYHEDRHDGRRNGLCDGQHGDSHDALRCKVDCTPNQQPTPLSVILDLSFTFHDVHPILNILDFIHIVHFEYVIFMT